jgi:hypothetical protein
MIGAEPYDGMSWKGTEELKQEELSSRGGVCAATGFTHRALYGDSEK